jgi:hypothetical protein
VFGFAAPGIPSFGDLSWKGPVVAASDPSAAWVFPVPVLSPAGDPVPGQTLTAQGNRSLNTEAPFLGMGVLAGNRVLIRETVGGGGFGGLWTVSVLGDGATPWQLLRTADGDTLAELPGGTLVTATAVLETGVQYNRPLVQYVGGLWRYVPNVTDFLTVLNSASIGTGLSSPALSVAGGVTADTLTATTSLSTVLSGSTVPTVNGGGTATFSGVVCKWVRIGPLVVFRVVFSVTAVGSGATAVTVTGTGLPLGVDNFQVLGDRSGVGVQAVLGRMTHGTGEQVVGAIRTVAASTVSLTGADLASGAGYAFTGAYLTS